MDDELRLAGPARAVPWGARLHLLLGGGRNQIGWALLGMAAGEACKGPSARLGAGLAAAFGLAYLGAGLRKGLRGMRLLRHGLVTAGSFVGKRQVSGGDTPVWAVTYRFVTTTGGTREVTTRTGYPGGFETRGPEPVVYDPADPSNAMALDDLPGRPRLGPDSVECGRHGGTWVLISAGWAAAGACLAWLR